MTDVLEWMAVISAGNWVITDEGRLLLLRYGDIPPETFYLVTAKRHPRDLHRLGGSIQITNPGTHKHLTQQESSHLPA